MKKELYTIETINITKWFNELPQDKKDALPLKVHYYLKKAVNVMADDVKSFEELRDNEMQKIRDIYFSEEKSDECDVPKNDDNGEPLKDADGKIITEKGRKIKPEYEESYKDAIEALDEKLKEILFEKNTYEYKKADVGEMIENMPDDSPLKNTDIDIIDAIFDETR